MKRKETGKQGARVREWLIQIREERGLTQGAVASAAEIAQPSYFEIEKGISTPRPETAKKIGNVLGFPWMCFYDDD